MAKFDKVAEPILKKKKIMKKMLKKVANKAKEGSKAEEKGESPEEEAMEGESPMGGPGKKYKFLGKK